VIRCGEFRFSMRGFLPKDFAVSAFYFLNQSAGDGAPKITTNNKDGTDDPSNRSV
jgi:hypothetical protein